MKKLLTAILIVFTLVYATPAFAALTQTLTDDFNDNSIDAAKWLVTGPGTPTNQVKEQNQQIELTTDGVTNDYYTLQSQNTYDLTGSYTMVKVVDSGNPPVNEAPNPLVLSNVAGTDKLFYSITNGLQLQAYKVVGGVQTQVGSNTAFGAGQKWLRIREAGGTIFWDYSPDGITWTNDESVATPITITALTQNIQTGQFGVGLGSTSKFDDFNIVETNNPRMTVNNAVKINSSIKI